MFDVGFWELLVLFVIGLLVLGPERLPRVARTVGGWVGRARAYARHMSLELEREVQRSELREQIKQSEQILNQPVDRLDGDDGQSRPG